jgi:hypothetical protein
MKTALKAWALIALMPVAVLAQESLDDEVNAELDRMYQAQPAQAAKPAPRQIQQRQVAPVQSNQGVQVTVQAAPIAVPIQSTSPQAVAVPQTSPANPAQAIKQPTTVIEASPLVESKAEKLRKTRQDAELSTEQGIVEKLEQSRLEDEKRRGEVLFGDKFNTLMSQGAAAQAAPAPVAPVATPAPAPAPVVPVVVPEQVVAAPIEPPPVEKELDRDAIRGEVSLALAEMKKTEEKPKSSTYMSLMLGAGDYPDAQNVKPQYSLGVGIGRELKERMFLEGSFQYSNYQVEQRLLNGSYYSGSCVYDYQGNCYPRITEMNQYSTSGLIKYQILDGMFRPEVGSLVSFTYRTFTDKQFAMSDATVTSQALDFGIMGGFSIVLTDSFSVGLDMRYMWNMTNKVDGTALQKSAIYQGYSQDTPIEQLSYWNSSVVARATF